MSKDLIDTKTIRPKLESIGQQLFPEHVYNTKLYDSFGSYLALRLGNKEVLPLGFVLCYQLVIYDLEQGVSCFSDKPIPGGLTGYPPMIYTTMEHLMVKIAELVFPADFAAEVKKFYEQVMAGKKTA